MRPALLILIAFINACAFALTGACADAGPLPKCPGDSVVWVNLATKTFETSESNNFGKFTRNRAYMCLAAARAAADIEYAPNIRDFSGTKPWPLKGGYLGYLPFRLDPPDVYVFAKCVASGGVNPKCESYLSTDGYTCENGDLNARTRNLLILTPNTPLSSNIARFSAIDLTSEPVGKAQALSCTLTLFNSSGSSVTYTFNAPAQTLP